MMLRMRDDEGIALLAVVLLVAGMIGLGTLMITVSTRTNESSVEQRVREASIQAADAGVSDSIACVMRLSSDGFSEGVDDCEAALRLDNDGDGNVDEDPEDGVDNDGDGQVDEDPPLTQLTDEGRDIGQYEILSIDEVSDPSLLPGEKMIEIDALGHAPRESGAHFESKRRVVARVKLEPFGGFRDTLYAGGPGGTVEVRNNARIDGSVYAEAVNLVKNNAVVGDVRTPGDFVTKNNDVYRSIWSGGDVTLGSNSSVTNDVQVCGDPDADKGDIHLEKGATIGGDLTYRGGANLSDDDLKDRVGGDVNVPTNFCHPPPSVPLPIYTYDQTDFEPPAMDPPPTVISFASVADANACLSETDVSDQPGVCDGETLGSGNRRIGGEFGVVVRVDDGSCPSSAGPVELKGNFTFENDFTLSTNCKLELEGTWGYDPATFASSAQAVFVSESDTGDDDIRIPKSLIVSDAALSVLLFTNGESEINNNLNVGSGAVYGSMIQANNNLDIASSASLESEPPPGFIFSQTARYIPFIRSWREAPTP